MNKVILVGRLTKDPDVRERTSGSESFKSARYTLAVNRATKDQNGNYQADFISCSCSGKTAEFAEKYLKKGIKIAVVGRILTGSYTNNEGQTVYTTEVRVSEHEFCEKAADNSNNKPMDENPAEGFMPLDGINEEELPFA